MARYILYISVFFLLSCSGDKYYSSWVAIEIGNIKFKSPEKPVVKEGKIENSVFTFAADVSVVKEIYFEKFKAILTINKMDGGINFLPSPCSDYIEEGMSRYINDMNVIVHITKKNANTNIVDLCINNEINFMFVDVKDEDMQLVEQIYNTIEVFDGKLKNIK